MDPIHQFQISKLFTILKIGATEVALTNSALYMILAVRYLRVFNPVNPQPISGARLQAAAEMLYEFVADMLRGAAGPEAMVFFPLVFTLFSFILVANVMGLIPYGFTVTSHIIITAALALLVFFTVIIAGFWKHGLRFLRVFVPSGIPIYILPLVTAIEVMSFLTRPLSHSVRLFANMLAGHITLKVFAGFIIMLGGAGILGILGASLPFIITLMLTALELLVAVLQAYVFAILTCIYLNDALHPGH
jgi:F-type H+-transporting ATPase subunit a